MRVELTILPRRRAGRDDAELSPTQVEHRTRQYLAVALDDHPRVERRVELPDVMPQPFIERPVHGCACGFTLRAPNCGILEFLSIVCVGCPAPRDAPPLARRI